MNRTADLTQLFSPRSVAVVGASTNLDSISGRPLALLRRFGFAGAVYPVNPKYSEVDGHTCYPDIASLPETPDVVLVGVRASLVEGVMEQCADRKVPFAVIFSAGFAESTDPEGQNRILAAARRGGVRLLGPNCQGLVNLAGGVPLSFSASLDREPPGDGHVAYVSQSGAFGFASFAMAAENGVGFRYVVTTGNQADLDAIDFAHYFISDPEVRLLVMYLEGLDDGERFLQMLDAASRRDLPVALLKAGRSGAAQEAAKSHTAALSGDQAVWDAIIEQYRVIPIYDAEDLVDMGRIFADSRRTGGGATGILTTSGGGGILLADQCDARGLSVPVLSRSVRSEIEKHIPPFGASRNPVDLTAQVINDPQGFPSCLRAVLESPGIDMATVLISMITGDAGRQMAEDLATVYRETEKPLACCWLIDRQHGGENMDYLREQGVPLFQSPRRCAGALAALREWSSRTPQMTCRVDEDASSFLDDLPPRLTEYDAKRLLGHHGIPVTRESLCLSLNEALSAAEEIGYPVALKVMSADILHKTEARIVALNLKDPEEVRNAYGRLLERAGQHAPEANISGVLVQEMVQGGVECMIGVRRDPVFGPMVAVGLGGIFVETLKDVRLRHAPVDEDMALEMIRGLKGYPLLKGVRGALPRDEMALARAVSAVSRMACVEEDLLELDVNPLFVMVEGEGVVAADALVVRR